jgi:hypothetical protein
LAGQVIEHAGETQKERAFRPGMKFGGSEAAAFFGFEAQNLGTHTGSLASDEQRAGNARVGCSMRGCSDCSRECPDCYNLVDNARRR